MNRNDLPEANATCEICGHKYRICKTCAQMRARGIESWRQHCDSYECSMYYYLLNKDYKDITEEEYKNVFAVELPEEREFTKEVQKKLDGVEHYFSEKKRESNKTQKAESNVQKEVDVK